MALVRKFQEAGKIDSDKKVLVYENVGNYDADKLASVLTLNLDDQAKSLDLSGKDRQAFMQYGAEMILAIKDGNVTKNADGSFSIKGNYGLNNKYSSSEVAEKFANGEVGYGAKKYEGTYQKSHGIFTTDETRDFRHRNHILGLVGQWVNNNLKSLDIIEEKTKEPEELKKFNFNDTFVRANLAGNASLLNDWKALINTQEGRNQALIKAIDNLTPEDYEAWALENPNLGSAADLLKLISPLRLALTDGDVKKAQELAFNLGISINDYILQDLLTSNNPQADPYLALARQQLTTGDNALGNPSEELIAQYAEYLRLEGKSLIEKSLLDKFNRVIDNAWLVELQRLRDELQGNEVFFDSQSTDNAIDPAKEKEVVVAEVGSMQHEMERMKSYIDDLGPDMDPKLQEGFGLTLDILGDTYNALVSGKAEYPEGFKDAWFQEITDGDYKGKVIFKWLLTDKYSIIYDPESSKFYRIPNLLLPETELFKLLKNAFAALIRNNKENNQEEEVPSEKQGGILKYEIGGGIQDATLLNWGGKKVTQTKPEKVDFAKARETAGLGDEHYEPQNANEPKKAFTPREINSFEDFLAEDYLRILSAVSDLGSLLSSSSGIGSAGLGLLSTGLDIAADINDDNVTKRETVRNGITGVAADIFSILPFAKTARTTSVISKLKGLSRYVPAITAGIAIAYGAEHADAFLQAYLHAIDGEFDSNDLYALTQGFRIVAGGFADFRRAHNVKRYTNHALVLGTKIMGTDGNWYVISDSNLAELKKIRDVKKANEFFRAKTKATVDLPITTEKKKNSKTKKEEKIDIPDIKTRAYNEIPEGFVEEASGRQRKVYVGDLDRQFANEGRIPSISLWFANKNNKVFSWINAKRGFTILPLEKMPTGARKISDTSFDYNGDIYVKHNDGLYHIDVPAPKNKKAKVVEEAPVAETPETPEVESKKYGGSLGFARNITIKMRNGGFVPKMEGGGWFEVTDNSNKKHYFKDKKAADWFREKNNITAGSKEVDSNAYDHGWYLGGLYDEWEKANYTKGKTGIPYNAALRDAAIKLETEDPEYKEFTKWVIDSLKEGKGNAYNAVIYYLHRMANLTDGQNYFKDDGETLIDNYDLILLNYYYDHARGYHHHKGTHRGNETLYYLNGELVDQEAVKDLTMDHEYGQESEDKTTTHKFYVTDNQGDTLNSGDQLIPATDETDPNAPLEYKNRLNWGNISEAGRVLWLNARNAKAAEQSMDWDPALAGYIHRNEMLEGDYEALKNAEEGQASLNSKAGLTFSTDANTQLAALLLATDQGNQLSQKAAQADSNKFYDSRHKILNLLNEDMIYNRKVADTNMAAIADKEKSDANIKANLTLENATNLSNMWAGISKQIMDGYDRRKQQLLHYEMKRAANRQAVAASEYNARKAALDTTDKKKYAEDLANLGKEYMDALDRSNIQELERTRRLLGPDVLHIASLVRRGRKLTADLRYILSGSQDFNRRKLSDAKEFYKNIRETQRRRKS